jgi:pimeloyl-ACP methyl ester carboxylesterase
LEAALAESSPIVLVPGLGSSLRTHLDILPALWRHGPVSVANHIRDDTIEAIARRALAEAPAAAFSLIGHSLGGYIVLEMMRQAPHRVQRLMLMNTQARTDPPEVTERRKATIAMIYQGRFEEAMEANFPLLVHPSRAGDAALREQLRLSQSDGGPEIYACHMVAIMARKDSRPCLKDIGVPTLVLSGDRDLLISNEFSREMADAIPDAVLEIVPQCGHMAPMEQPAAVIAAMERWLAR